LNATLKLLIVEGHDRVRAALAQRLHRTPGLHVLAAVGDVPSALSLLEEWALDLVLCDPHTLTGDRRRAIRTLAATGRPIVVWTSSLVEGEAAMLRGAGAAAVLLKDLDLTQLLHTIQALGRADTSQWTEGAAGPIDGEAYRWRG
jgi:DNA-binding NarL/FixJ family response regulator